MILEDQNTLTINNTFLYTNASLIGAISHLPEGPKHSMRMFLFTNTLHDRRKNWPVVCIMPEGQNSLTLSVNTTFSADNFFLRYVLFSPTQGAGGLDTRSDPGDPEAYRRRSSTTARSTGPGKRLHERAQIMLLNLGAALKH